MKAKQFPYVADENSSLMAETERELNDFLREIQFRNVQYSGVSGINALNKTYVTGMVLVQYEDRTPNPEEIVQMKQFPLGTFDNLREPTHKTLNDFLASEDVKDIKYSAVSGRNQVGEEFVTGLALVVYRPAQE